MKRNIMKRNIIRTSNAEGGNRFEITPRYLYQLTSDGKRFRRVRLTDLHIALGYYVGFGWFVIGQERFIYPGTGWEDKQWRAKYYHDLPHKRITIGCMLFEGRNVARILKAAKVKR